jgi:flavin reductase (DIM6/NTAB) family NADH-FMN oxidoreductase RutF
MPASDYAPIDSARAALWVPAPVIFVAAAANGARNVMIAIRLLRWGDPPQSSVLVGVAKHSLTGELLRTSGEFSVGLLTDGQQDLITAGRQLSQASSRDVDKFAAFGLQTLPATQIQAPLVDGCAMNLECRLRRYVDVDDPYDVVIGDIVALHVRRGLAPLLLVAGQPCVLAVDADLPPNT